MKSIWWNDLERRPRALWRLLAGITLFVGFTLCASLVLIGIGIALAGLQTDPYALERLTIPAELVGVFGSMWIAARWIDRRPFAAYGLHLNRLWWLDFWVGLGLGALLMAGIFLVEWAAGWVSIDGLWRTSLGLPFGLALSLQVLIFVCVGVAEELLFRGYIVRNLAESFNTPRIGAARALVLAWLLSSVLFGLAHAANPNASMISTLNIALAGIFLGLGYILTGELGLPIGLHITWNFFQGNVFGFPVSGQTTSTTVVAIVQQGPELWTGGRFGPEAGLLGIVAMLVGGLLVLGWVRVRNGALQLHDALAVYTKEENLDASQP